MPYLGLALSGRAYEPIFYANSTENVTYYCEAACYEWIQTVAKEEDMDAIQWMEILLPFDSLATKPLPSDYKPVLSIDYLDEFPMRQSDTPYAVSIFNFFHQLSKQQHKNDIERLEYAITAAQYPSAPTELLERLVAFSIEHILPKHQRIRATFSPRIRPFLKGM